MSAKGPAGKWIMLINYDIIVLTKFGPFMIELVLDPDVLFSLDMQVEQFK